MKKKNLSSLRRILPLLRPYRLLAAATLLCSLVYVAGQLLIPILSGQAIDHMLGWGRVELAPVLRAGALIACTAALSALCQHLLALCNAVFGAVVIGVLIVLPVEGLRKLVCKLKQLLELIAVKIALARRPVDKVVHVEVEAYLQYAVTGGVLVERLATLRHGGKRLVELFIGPSRSVADNGGRAYRCHKIEAGAGGVHPAVDFERLEDVREEIVATKLAVVVYIRIEILQQALRGELSIRHAVEVDNVGRVPGEKLSCELGPACGIVVLSVVLGIVNDLNTVLVVLAVEVYYLAAHVPAEILCGKGDGLLVRHRVVWHKADGGNVDGIRFVNRVIIVYEADHGTVVVDGKGADRIAVYIAVDPAEELGGLPGIELHAVEIDAAGVVYVVVSAAGVNGISVIGH